MDFFGREAEKQVGFCEYASLVFYTLVFLHVLVAFLWAAHIEELLIGSHIIFSARVVTAELLHIRIILICIIFIIIYSYAHVIYFGHFQDQDLQISLHGSRINKFMGTNSTAMLLHWPSTRHCEAMNHMSTFFIYDIMM